MFYLHLQNFLRKNLRWFWCKCNNYVTTVTPVPKKETSCLKWTEHNGGRKVSVNLKTDTDNLIFVVYCYRNKLILKNNEFDLKLTDYQSHFAKKVQLQSCIDMFFKRCIELDEETVHKQTPSRKDILFLLGNSRLYPGLKLSFEPKYVRKSLLLGANFCWVSRLFWVRRTETLISVEPVVMVTRTWILSFVISNYSDYMQYYLMLLEQCGHIVEKDLATVTCLDEDQICVFLVTWLDYFFLPFALKTFCLPFLVCRFLRHYVLHIYKILSWQV